MTARYLGRGFGVVIRCNADDCDARHQTANVVIKYNRIAAKAAGWIRGGAKAVPALTSVPRTCRRSASS